MATQTRQSLSLTPHTKTSCCSAKTQHPICIEMLDMRRNNHIKNISLSNTQARNIIHPKKWQCRTSEEVTTTSHIQRCHDNITHQKKWQKTRNRLMRFHGGGGGVSLLLAHFVFKSYDEHTGLLKCTQIWALPTERLHTSLYLQQKQRWHSVSTQNA